MQCYFDVKLLQDGTKLRQVGICQVDIAIDVLSHDFGRLNDKFEYAAARSRRYVVFPTHIHQVVATVASRVGKVWGSSFQVAPRSPPPGC